MYGLSCRISFWNTRKSFNNIHIFHSWGVLQKTPWRRFVPIEQSSPTGDLTMEKEVWTVQFLLNYGHTIFCRGYVGKWTLHNWVQRIKKRGAEIKHSLPLANETLTTTQKTQGCKRKNSHKRYSQTQKRGSIKSLFFFTSKNSIISGESLCPPVVPHHLWSLFPVPSPLFIRQKLSTLSAK